MNYSPIQFTDIEISTGPTTKYEAFFFTVTYLVKGFRLFDKVRYSGKEGFIFGRRSSGYFDIRKLDGTVIHQSAKYSALSLLDTAGAILTERRMQGAV